MPRHIYKETTGKIGEVMGNSLSSIFSTELGVVVHAYNPSYAGSIGKRIKVGG
jgi:hypothetical protein